MNSDFPLSYIDPASQMLLPFVTVDARRRFDHVQHTNLCNSRVRNGAYRLPMRLQNR